MHWVVSVDRFSNPARSSSTFPLEKSWIVQADSPQNRSTAEHSPSPVDAYHKVEQMAVPDFDSPLRQYALLFLLNYTCLPARRKMASCLKHRHALSLRSAKSSWILEHADLSALDIPVPLARLICLDNRRSDKFILVDNQHTHATQTPRVSTILWSLRTAEEISLNSL
ncbi:hypothetical protein D9M68_495600 [compost metagenome]